jgi:hypothetical protein
MAVIQAVLALVSRSLGKVVAALFGWAVVALFGQTRPREKIWLSVLVGGAAAWPILLLGVAWPRVATAVLAFVPLPAVVPSWSIRLVWILLAALVPFAVGVAVAARADRPRSVFPGTTARADLSIEEREESTLRRLLRGIPITIAIAVSFFLVFVSVPMQRIASMVRRRLDVHVPLVTDARAYQVVAAEIAATLSRHNFAVAASKPPWWLTAPSRVLLGLGGPSFRDYIPERLAYFRGPRLDIVLYPNGLLLRGREQDTAWAHGVVVEALSDAPAYQTFDPRAQDVERQIRNVWRAFQRNPGAHQASRWLATRFGEIAHDIRELPVSYDEWQIVYRQALQLGRALRCERQLLEKTQPSTGNKAITQPEEASMMKSGHGDSIRVQSVPTRDLLSGIVSKATLLARKEVELVKAEIKADLQTHISMVKSLAIAALFAVLGLNVLLVAAVFALAPYVAPWLAALVLGGALVAAGVVLGYVGWARRVVNPLALTRKTLREDLQWAKEHLA